MLPRKGATTRARLVALLTPGQRWWSIRTENRSPSLPNRQSYRPTCRDE